MFFGLGGRPVLLAVEDYYSALGFSCMDILEVAQEWLSICGQRGWEAIDRTAELIGVAMEAQVPVLYTKAFGRRLSPWNSKNSFAVISGSDGPDPLEIAADVAPHLDDIVIEKSMPSAFQGTSLEIILRSWGTDTILVCGVRLPVVVSDKLLLMAAALDLLLGLSANVVLIDSRRRVG